MELFDDNNCDFTLEDLFPSGDFSSLFADVSFSDGLQLEDDFPNQTASPLLLNAADDGYDLTTNGDYSSELNRLLLDVQDDNKAILNEAPFFGDSVVNQNVNVINSPVPQQASGNQDGIMYQMYPSLFDSTVVMSVKQQPKANNRSRYQCDGPRFLPDSRYHPMSIELRNSQSILLTPNQQLGIVMTMVTDANNPHNQTIVHANDIIYRVDDAKKIGHGCVFAPLEKHRQETYEQKFSRLSIIYKKCDEYTFDITPFDKLTMFGTTEEYLGKNTKNVGKAAKGKDFKKDYNLSSYKIVFHLAVKENNVVYISNVTCETETVDEQKSTTQSNKRSASVCTENYSEEESSSDIPISSPTKKFKSSTRSMTGLPVTRVSNRDTDFNKDLD